MKRWAVYRFSPWLTFWAVSILGGLWLLTEPGLQWIWMMARPQLPPTLVVGDVRGSLIDGVEVENIQWNDAQVSVRLRSARFNLELRSLIRGKIQIDPLKLRELSIQQRPTKTPQEEIPEGRKSISALPSLPYISFPDIDLAGFAFKSGESRPFRVERLRARAMHQDGQLSFQLLEFRQAEKPVVVGRLAANLERTSIQLKTLAIGPSDGGQIRLTGALNLAERIRAEFNFFVEDFNPAPWIVDDGLRNAVSQIQGSGQVFFEHVLKTGQSGGGVRDVRLQSQWQDHQFAVSASALGWSEQTFEIEGVELSSGSAQVNAHGVWGLDTSNNKIELSANVDDLADIIPESTGNVSLSAIVSGALKEAELRVDGRAENLLVGEFELEQADWNGVLSAANSTESKWGFTAQGVQLGMIRFDTLTSAISGPISSTLFRLQASGPELELNLAAKAVLQNPNKARIDLEALTASYTDKESWRLSSKTASIQRLDDVWTVPEHCFRDTREAELCVNYEYRGSASHADLHLRGYDLAKLTAWAKDPSLVTQGQVGLSATLRPKGGTPLGEIQGQLSTSAISLARKDNSTMLPLLNFKPGGAAFSYGPQGLVTQLDIASIDGGYLQLDLKTDARGEIDHANGRLLLNDLTALSLASSEVLEAQGQLGAEWEAQGNLFRGPQSEFRAQLKDGYFRLNSPQILLSPVNLELNGDTRQILLSGGLTSGEGQIAVAGSYRFAERLGEILLNGEDFEVANSVLAQVWISPDVKITLQDKRVDIAGQIQIPVAHIHPDKLPKAGSDYIAPSEDQVILFDTVANAPRKEGAMQLFSQVRITLGDKVKFSGFGLKTEIKGGLDVAVEPGKKPTGNGILELHNGKYKAYGQDLTLERGRILFSGGPVVEPGLDIRASRKPSSNVTVGVQIRGNASQPEITLWSDPTMEQTEQLSWLVLGRSGQATNTEDEASLQTATLALGLKGSDFLAKRVKGKLGLDEISIGAQPGEQSSQAALVLGKYLNPRIYVSYGIGLFEPVYTFRMRYSISDKWTIQTESGIESSGDIVYTVER